MQQCRMVESFVERSHRYKVLSLYISTFDIFATNHTVPDFSGSNSSNNDSNEKKWNQSIGNNRTEAAAQHVNT